MLKKARTTFVKTILFWFLIAPPVIAESLFAIIGDYGDGSTTEASVAGLVYSWNPDFIITMGDNRYGSMNFDKTVGQFYCDSLTDAGSGAFCSGSNSPANAFFPSLGNHDYTDGARLDEYLNYFTLPGAGVDTSGTSGNERYYDFIRGPVHFFVIDSRGARKSASDEATQMAWLQAQLAASSASWQIVYFHRPPYSSGSHGSNTEMQWPFALWGADAVISGHDHTYERIFADEIVYFVNGLGGRNIYNFNTPISGSQVRYNGDYGAMRVNASDTAITFEFISLSGSIIDTYTIKAETSDFNIAPVAAFIYSCTGLDCSFTDTSTDSDGSVTAWFWDFGDGDSSTARNPGHSYVVTGTYTVSLTVTDNAGSTHSTTRSETVAPVAPIISTQPTDQTADEGDTATFSVSASGSSPLSHQWQKDGVDIPGAINSSYTTPAAMLTDGGTTFLVVVTNSAGSIASNSATLNVNAATNVPPVITTPPADQSVVEGNQALFTVGASGTAPLSYQWLRDGIDIISATNPTYATTATTLIDDGSSFRVVVTNSLGSITSNAATLTVIATQTSPAIITDPISQTVNEGQGATFNVAANGTEPLTYQWQRDGVDIPGAISMSYSIPVATLADSGATFWVVVGNAAGSVTSGTATLIVNPQDSNDDGLSDADAIMLGLDPNDPDGDTDNDELSDVLEIGGDIENPIDSDLDGIIDALEPDSSATDATTAAGLPLADGGAVVTISAGGETLSDVSSTHASGAPSGISFPFGILSYTTTSAVGGSVTTRIEFSANLPVTMDLYKVNDGEYRLLPASIWTMVGARTLDITLTDGDPITDLDGVTNGSIKDPVAVAAVTLATTPAPSSIGGGGGGGGCITNDRAESDLTFPLLIFFSLLYLSRRTLIRSVRIHH